MLYGFVLAFLLLFGLCAYVIIRRLAIQARNSLAKRGFGYNLRPPLPSKDGRGFDKKWICEIYLDGK